MERYGTDGGASENSPLIEKCGNFSFGSDQEKLNADFILLMTFDTVFFAALIGVSIADLMLLNTLDTVDLMEFTADEMVDFTLLNTDEIVFLAALIGVSIADLTALNAVCTADFTLFTAFEIVDLIVLKTLVMVFFAALIAFSMALFTALNAVETAFFTLFTAFVTVDVIAFQAVETADFTAFSAVDTAFLIAFQAVETAFLMPSKIGCNAVFTAVQAVEMAVLMLFNAFDTVDLMASHALKIASLQFSQMKRKAKPYEVYETDVIDLASLNPVYSEILHYDIGDVVWLISRQSGVKAKMRIAKITKYPLDPKKNTCELSNTKKSFADIQAEQTAQIVDEAVAVAGGNTDEKIEESDGLTSEEIALEMEAMKTEIIKDISDTYADKKTVESGNAATLKSAKTYTDKQLENYKTGKQTDDAIDAAKRAVAQDVANTYTTKDAMTLALHQQASALEESFAETLTDFSTTEETAKQIEDSKVFVDSETGKKYKLGIRAGLLFIEEIE